MNRFLRLALPLLAIALAFLAEAGPVAADEYRFMPAPQTDLNRIYRVNRLTGEMGACQYAVKEGTIGVALCYPAGEGGGPQPVPGDYDLVRSNHEREGGIFRVNTRTGEISVCYVLTERVVCTPQAR
jgi:hypothetical protein